ncbi:MAG: 3-phosphoshikimate 1-carboxyvinyltransferase [Sphingomicrobium sp.]
MSADQLIASKSGPLGGTNVVPGDKSISHRALILGGLAEGTTRIHGLLEGEDVLATARAVEALGARVERIGGGEWRVTGAEWRSPGEPVDCGNSGTGARLLMGAAAGFPISVTFTGDASLSGRPMGRVLGPLREMGAGVEAAAGDRMPVTIHGGNLNGLSFVNEKASAQVKSAILLAGLHAHGEVEVIEPAKSRDHSENMFRAFGVEVEAGERVRLGAKRTLTATEVSVPGDPSSAAFPLVAALIVPGSVVTVTSVMTNVLRTGLFTTLAEMGADLTIASPRVVGGETVADITARFGPLKGLIVPAERAPSMIDEYPILAIAAAVAQGRSVMHGLAELRVKESDRLAAIIAGLNACGILAREDGDSLIVEGLGAAPRGGSTIDAHHDHRIAMSFLTLGLASAEPVTVTGAATIATSFPNFAALMTGLGADIR